MHWFKFGAGATFIVVVAVYTAVFLGNSHARRLAEQVQSLELQREQLVAYAERLSASRRVAQIDVVSQRRGADGRLTQNLLWQEIGPTGILSRPVALETIGELVYVEALVLKFQPRLVGAGDSERGASLCLFRRAFGEDQPPSSGAVLDRGDRPPLDDPRKPNPLYDELWARFWDLASDPELADSLGVRTAQIEAPAVPMKPGQVWEVTLDAAGGLNLRRLTTATAPTVGFVP